MSTDVNPLLDRLCQAFPACFNRSAPKPLKIGLGEELLALAGVHPALADLTRTRIRRAIQFYTGSPAYRKALQQGGPRYDLAGQPAGEVTPEQQRDASRPRKTPPAPEPPAAPTIDLKVLLQEGIALAIAGQPDAAIDGGFRPEKPAMRAFEPKAEPEAAATPAPKAPEPKVPAPTPNAPTPKMPTPPGSSAMGYAQLSLKRRT